MRPVDNGLKLAVLARHDFDKIQPDGEVPYIGGGIFMFRFVVVAALGAGVSGCAQLKDVSSITGVTKAFSTQIEVAPAYFETVATDYQITSNEYQFLTGRSCDALRSPGIVNFLKLPLSRKVKGKTVTLTYSEYEQERLMVKSRALDFLNKYAQRMKDQAQAAENVTTFAGYANTGADIADSVPVFGTQAAPYTAAARGIVAVINRYANDFSAAAMVAIARESDAKLKIMVEQIRKDYGIINVDAKIYLSAWKECQVAKINAMRTPLAGLGQTSAAELDAVYSAHLKQLVEYQKAIPTVDDELKAIVEANTKIATSDFNTALGAAQEMVGAANAAYKALQAVQKL